MDQHVAALKDAHTTTVFERAIVSLVGSVAIDLARIADGLDDLSRQRR